MKEKAIALKYPKNAFAPFITAKGEGLSAKKIVEIAQENNIPIRVEEEVIDILNAQDIGTAIPEQTWEVLAIVFSSIMGH